MPGPFSFPRIAFLMHRLRQDKTCSNALVNGKSMQEAMWTTFGFGTSVGLGELYILSLIGLSHNLAAKWEQLAKAVKDFDDHYEYAPEFLPQIKAGVHGIHMLIPYQGAQLDSAIMELITLQYSHGYGLSHFHQDYALDNLHENLSAYMAWAIKKDKEKP